jgi:hypothetical protein
MENAVSTAEIKLLQVEVCGYSCKGVLTEFEGSHHRESALKSVV